jgi:exopolyphosphatase/guanosine-5'-triphosphate,3'-diphosphate pyrophosphatase
MRLAAIDIGTNSMRLLLVEQVGDGLVELGRFERVTGLGRGVDASGLLSDEAIDRTLLALAEFGGRMAELKVDRRRAVATSAARDASNRDRFFDQADLALGVRPEMITGEEEAALAFAGATDRIDGPGPFLIVDIGGGSTEFVTADGGRSFDIGSVRLTERVLGDRPATVEQMTAARALVAEAFLPVTPFTGTVVGVAGTWTSLARIVSSGGDPHLATLTASQVSALADRMAGLTVEATASLPGLDPARAPVILAGAVVAEAAVAASGCSEVVVSVHDLLDGVVAGLAGGRT